MAAVVVMAVVMEANGGDGGAKAIEMHVRAQPEQRHLGPHAELWWPLEAFSVVAITRCETC